MSRRTKAEDRAGARARHRVAPEALRRRCDPQALGFATTEELDSTVSGIGQDRALASVDFALAMPGRGYNLFVTGATGTAKRAVLEQRLKSAAAERPAPPDVVYLFNFDDPRRPVLAELPHGRGSELKEAVAGFVAEARKALPNAFESQSYQQRRQQELAEVERQQEAGLAEIRRFGQEHGLAVDFTPIGIRMVPVVGGKPISAEEYEKLPPESKLARDTARRAIERRMAELMATVRRLERDARDRLRAMDREVALLALEPPVADLKERFADIPAIERWIDELREDMVGHLDDFRAAEALQESQVPAPIGLAAARAGTEFFRRYEVNLFVTHPDDGAPVVSAINPTYHTLFGAIEYESQLGALATDHLHLRPGDIHRANGGFLLLDALELVSRPFLWDKLKEALRTGTQRLENLGQQFTLFPTVSLSPAPMPLELKVILLGPSEAFRLLYELDEDVRDLFRVKAEFDVTMPWTDDGIREYAAFIAGCVRDEGLRHFSADAVASVVEHGARLAGHREKLSTRVEELGDLLAQASHWAGEAGAEVVDREHVERAIAERVRRSNLVEEKIDELVAEGVLVIEVEGQQVGEVNGVAVIDLGDHRFGRPMRVTATTGAGAGRLVSIDRETKLSGSLHDKGFLIVRGYLQWRYGRDLPLSLGASLTFEQSYDEVQGDSAASAELYALLSSLADVPIDQGIAVTGSVDQHGRIQAIGALNEKIEGFYDVCLRKGLTGSQGVLAPRANLADLMLRDDVAAAVDEGRFHVWAVDTVDDGIELLTGVPAGARGADGTYPSGTVHDRVRRRLLELAETAHRYAQGPVDGRADAARPPDGSS